MHKYQQQAQQQVLPERTLWSYIVQLASAIKKVHERGQAVRMLDVTKILVTGQNRLVILFFLGSFINSLDIESGLAHVVSSIF